MSKYSKPKRNVQNFNADNFETEIIQKTSDVLKITQQEQSSKFSFYTIPEIVYTNQPKIQQFVNRNKLTKIIDDDMKFTSPGSYHIRFNVNFRPLIDSNLILVCNLSSLEQFFRITPGLYNQITWEDVVYVNSGDELYFQLLTTKGDLFSTDTNNLRLVNTTMAVQQISTQDVL